ncbi:MAG: FAD-dependent tricarballylate dehydrogenase TcuA [Pseudomonadales bacterium]|nr:FAD-dependent tricarballylate dehydrogenase TcuA [Pseudomonadales bacterium]
MSKDIFDVVVVGAGNAALCAAISARLAGARVLVLEKATEEEKGGNSYFTAGGFRFMHAGLEDIRQDILADMNDEEAAGMILPSHDRQFFYETLMAVTQGQSDEGLAATLIDKSRETMGWLTDNGIRFIPMYGRQSYEVEGKHHFYGGVNIESVGGGAGLVESLVSRCAQLDIEIRYGTAAYELLQHQDYQLRGVKVRAPSGYAEIESRAVILACGGFESNPEWRVRYLGQGWDLARVRGTRHNTGDGIKMAMDIGALPFGNWSGCHSVGWDISAPPFGDRWVLDNFQKHSYPLGIMVNLDGERFVDEGEDYRNLTYVRFGKAIMSQPQRTAVQIFDQKTVHRLRDEYRIHEVTRVVADTIEALAIKLEIDPDKLHATIEAYNNACQGGDYNPAILDGVATSGITPAKSNWALPIDKPPYEAFITTTGVTFTFGGLKIDQQNRVQDLAYQSIPGLFAAGELVGGLFYENYPGGTGLMSGSVFGKLAGEFAASYARET